jgi:hypothetical protein
LRHYATSRKAAGSIPDGSLGLFIDLSFQQHYGAGDDSASSRHEYQEYLLEVKGPVRRADKLATWKFVQP